MNRRQMMYGGVAAAAGLAGAGVAWWAPGTQAATGAPAKGTKAAQEMRAAVDAFWRLSFDTPDGKPLPIAQFRGKPLLVNFWATWCPPCIEELPLLDAFYQENQAKDWQVVGLAVDQLSAVRKWLQVRPLSFPVGMAGLAGAELSRSLGNLRGVLPFTAVFGASGELLHRKTGKVSPEELALWATLK